ncbi:thioredoxin domain-containing protein [Diaphorobacter caeni]|uniref:hydrogenase n=1 Tax=Diaphorobacter caeni TaxID=2784387 RepID=UPI00188E446F|nr:hydrogenase [Diaphorobacter caeni]MBF5005649.1 hydrogenase [Diaphorobacter caeni]
MTTDTETAAEVVISTPIARPASHPAMDADAPSPAHAQLVCRLADSQGATWVDEDSIEAWSAQGGDRVVLLAGDPVRFPQGLDVAAVLPELRKCADRTFEFAVVPRAAEDRIARRYGANHWPTLLFLRDGKYVTAIGGMHDWTPYLSAVNAALQMPTSRAPTVGIPVVGAGASNASSCS